MSNIINTLIKEETDRQNRGIELIASENYASKQVREAMSSIFTNKYAEGYPGHRYYGGCEIVDKLEEYAQKQACKLFECEYANVQPHSGSQANFAAYRALLPNGGKILSLDLNDGGHLTHGSKVSFSGNMYEFYHYKLRPDGEIDYVDIKEQAEKHNVDLIVAGASAYPFEIQFDVIRTICNDLQVKLMVDMAHIAGLVAADKHMSPIPYADVVTSTTHKTLRGPRGGLILTNDEELYKAINKAVFPYTQGGPLEHVIAAKAICFEEADTFRFVEYIDKVIKNTETCCDRLATCGALVSGTENHMFLLNTYNSYGLTGAQAQAKLEKIGITTNKNMIPGDTKSPNETSGLRIGFAAATTRGCTEQDAARIGTIIHLCLNDDSSTIELQDMVKQITINWLNIEEI